MDKKEVKESFCPACLSIPLAFVGVGSSTYSSGSRGKYKSQKKWALIIGIISTVISIAIAVYYLYIVKCKTCVYKS